MKRISTIFLTAALWHLYVLAVSSARAGEDSCTREDLAKIADKYFESIREHKASDLPLASTVKFTENGVKTDVGKGFWETAGKPLLKRTLIDTKKCVMATMAVMEEPFSSETVGSELHGRRGGYGGGGAGDVGGGPPGGAGTPGGAPGGARWIGRYVRWAENNCPKREPSGRSCSLIRLKVENGNITEIESIIARERDFAFNAQKELENKRPGLGYYPSTRETYTAQSAGGCGQ